MARKRVIVEETVWGGVRLWSEDVGRAWTYGIRAAEV